MTRELTAGEVDFVLECLPEEVAIEGNCSAIDEETDAETASWTRNQLEQGNEWAWCCVKVTARWGDFEGCDYLGCCSYESEQAFREGGYWEDMKAVALEELNREIARMAEQLEELK